MVKGRSSGLHFFSSPRSRAGAAKRTPIRGPVGVRTSARRSHGLGERRRKTCPRGIPSTPIVFRHLVERHHFVEHRLLEHVPCLSPWLSATWVSETDPCLDHSVVCGLGVVVVVVTVPPARAPPFALYLAARRQRTQELELAQREKVQAHVEQVAEHDQWDAAARRVTDLYGKSVEQLGSDKAAVRLGGMYALERLAQDNPEQRPTVVSVFCAYLRMSFEPPVTPPESEDTDCRTALARVSPVAQPDGNGCDLNRGLVAEGEFVVASDQDQSDASSASTGSTVTSGDGFNLAVSAPQLL